MSPEVPRSSARSDVGRRGAQIEYMIFLTIGIVVLLIGLAFLFEAVKKRDSFVFFPCIAVTVVGLMLILMQFVLYKV